jgi:methylenetetrahydrofolate reductase (NADPH)
MKHLIGGGRYIIEVPSPKQNSKDLDGSLRTFADKYRKVFDAGHCISIPDNPMGHLAFQGVELIEELGLPVSAEQVLIHINTFHTKNHLNMVLATCLKLGINQLLIISGDGSERLPRLKPDDLGTEDTATVTSIELINYIRRTHPGKFIIGAAFNQYEPKEYEHEKMRKKIEAGAGFIISQPVLGDQAEIRALEDLYGLPVFIEAWMSKNLNLLADCIGYDIPPETVYDPMEGLKNLHAGYPRFGVYLAILGFKTQFPLLAGLGIEEGTR